VLDAHARAAHAGMRRHAGRARDAVGSTLRRHRLLAGGVAFTVGVAATAGSSSEPAPGKARRSRLARSITAGSRLVIRVTLTRALRSVLSGSGTAGTEAPAPGPDADSAADL